MEKEEKRRERAWRDERLDWMCMSGFTEGWGGGRRRDKPLPAAHPQTWIIQRERGGRDAHTGKGGGVRDTVPRQVTLVHQALGLI